MEMKIRTDLAIEAKESFEGTNVEVSGVVLEEKYISNSECKVTRVHIRNKSGAEAMGKPMGNYITIEGICNVDTINTEQISREIKLQIARMIGERRRLLIVGLGNREATPDSLGPRTIAEMNICADDEWEVMALAPGVLAQTGMETADMIKGVVRQMKPEIVIAIDSLAARSAHRLINTIQLSDTGINPGSGVGNHRTALNRDTLGVEVIAIGIPTVIESATIVYDTLDTLNQIIPTVIESFDSNEKYSLIKELLVPDIRDMYVTPKDIDANVEILAKLLSASLSGIWSK